MTIIVYRVQDAEGRGPWRPGFSHKWVRDRADQANLIPWYKQFQRIITVREGEYVGCACRTQNQLRRWFTVDEYTTLLGYGYQAVKIDVQSIFDESEIQLVFRRKRPLFSGALAVNLYEAAQTEAA